MKQPGFMIYVDDWEAYTADYSDEEIGQMLKALLSYFTVHKQADFSDRGMRQFFRQAAKAIDLDAKRYTDKCLRNAYSRYKGICKDREETPLSFEEWLTNVDERQPRSTTVDERQPKRPIPITNTNTNTNNQRSIINNQQSVTSNQRSEPAIRMNTNSEIDCRGETPRAPLSPDEFEKSREAALAALREKKRRSSS